jgi:hypothetical protein
LYISNNSSRKIEDNNQYQSNNLPKVVSPYSPQRISSQPMAIYGANSNNNSNNTLNYSSSTGGIYQLGGSRAMSPTRTYGKGV